jgi:hypothetical protein
MFKIPRFLVFDNNRRSCFRAAENSYSMTALTSMPFAHSRNRQIT